jgi:hypothetical protein
MKSPSEGLLPAALGYAKRGWPVFPVWPGQKTPLTKDGFKSATTQREAILTWWHQWPDANIGIATGIAFDVLDIDGPEGRDALRAWLVEREYLFIGSGPIAYTGRGWHYLFLPTGSGNAAGLVPKVDYRGLGGYIVAPPSLHPLGHHYQWYAHRPANTALPTAPAWLTELLGERIERREATARVVVIDKPTPGTVATVLTNAGLLALSRPDILGVAHGLGLYVVQSGGTTFARCPFHHGLAKAQVHAGTPSMMLDLAKNNFYCHSCHAYGDSLDLQSRRDINGTTF